MTAAASAHLPAPSFEPKIQVKKRSGKIVDYQPQKITQVVKLCLVNGCAWRVDDVETTRFAEQISNKVNAIVGRMDGTVSVETIQDLVTLSLEVENPDIAQAFRTYREEHRKLRLDTNGLFAKRVAFKPFEYPQFSEFKDAIRHSYWVHTEWNFLADIHDFNSSLEPAERNAIKNALLAISQIEIAVKRFWSDIGKRFPKPEIEQVGVTFGESEVRHADAYSHLLQILGLDTDFDNVLSVPAIHRRVNYLDRSLKAEDTEDKDFSLKVALFSMFIENCSLFSQFAVIKSFAKHRSMLKDVDNVVQATQREETLHAMFGAALINEIKKERPEWFGDDFWSQLRSAARDAYEAEAEIIDWIFEQGELPFLSSATLKEFVKHRINESFEMIDGGKAVFDINRDLLQPLDWFNQELKLDVSIDFFHTKSTAYSKHTQSYKGRDLIRDVEEPVACATAGLSPDIDLDEARHRPRYWWLNDPSRAMLESGVLLEGVTPEMRIKQIADHASNLLDDETFSARFMRYMSMGFYSLASPIWANFGLDRGLPISCFGSHVEDSIQGITSTLSETTIMSKYGGGTSGFFGEVRPRGSSIKNNGKSHGSVNFMQQFDTMIKVVSQGSTRRGQFAAYLDADHADFDEFMRIRSDGNPIQDLSFGACFSDEFMTRLLAEEEAARNDISTPTPTLDRWGSVLEKRSKIGTPYMFWTDNANRQAPKWYRDAGMKINHSNLCVTGDQLAVTSTGLRRVRDLAASGGPLILFDGESPVKATPMQLIRKDADVVKVRLASGREHRVTPDHKVKTDKGMVRADRLQPGDRVAYQLCEGMFGRQHEPDRAFLLGLYHGDGTQSEKDGTTTTMIDLWEHDFDLVPEVESAMGRLYAEHGFDEYEVAVPGRGTHTRSRTAPCFSDCVVADSGVSKKRLGSAKLKSLGFDKVSGIPDWILQGTKDTQVQYLRGRYYADGTVTIGDSKGCPLQLGLCSTDKDTLQTLQIMLGNLGVKASIYVQADEGMKTLPDGRGGNKEYWCQKTWRLCISNKPDALKFNRLTGFLDRKGVNLEDRDYRDNTRKFDCVVDVLPDGVEDVFCTTVHTDEHVWTCNGIITSNCTEIMLPNGADESFVCDLSSLNLHLWPEIVEEGVEVVVYTLIQMLDAVMTEFINKASKIPHMEKAVRFATRHRALGMGVLGWHSYFQRHRIAIDTPLAHAHNRKVFADIEKAAVKATEHLAKRYGEPDVMKGTGRRNSTLMAIAPTKSSSFILGQTSEGIEPWRQNVVVKKTQKGTFTVHNPELERVLEEYGKNTEAVWNNIIDDNGSVQNLEFLSENDKAVFRTFVELPQMELITHAAERQQYIDQGQSLNLMIDPTVPAKEISDLYIKAWQYGIKSLYYQYSVNAAHQLQQKLTTCTSCEG